MLVMTDGAGDFSDDTYTPGYSELITKVSDFFLHGSPVWHSGIEEFRGYSLK